MGANSAYLVTPAVTIKTDVPAPEQYTEGKIGDYDDPLRFKTRPSATAKVQLQACSELTDYARPVNVFDGTQELVLQTDGNGNPMLISVGADKRLYILLHVDGASHAWQQYDITPPNTAHGITAFDCFESPITHTLHLAAAQQQDDGSSIIYHATVEKPKPQADHTTHAVTSFDSSVSWTSLPNSLGAKCLTSLLCGPRALSTSEGAGFSIFAGSAATKDLAGAFYSIDPSPGISNPWSVEAGNELNDRTFQIRSASVQGTGSSPGPAQVSLYQTSNGNSCSLRRLDTTTGKRSNFSLMATGMLGQPRAIHSCSNPFKYSNVVIAGDQGIAFYDHRNLAGEPAAHVLESVGFKQVVCSEDGVSATRTAISIFAVSEQNDLYFVKGTRLIDENRYEWIHSGLPIRRNVMRIATQVNRKRGTCDLLMLGSGSNELYHLARDESTSLWTESRITVNFKSDKPPLMRQTYLTTLTVTDDRGKPVPAGYPLVFTSEPQFVIANDRTYTFDSRPTEVLTDAKGRILIAIEPDSSLRAPTLYVHLPKFATNDTKHAIYPAQRVLRQLGRYQDKDSLKSATSSDGRSLLSNNVSEESLDQAAQVMSQLPAMFQQVDQSAATAVLPAGIAMQPLKEGNVISVEKNGTTTKRVEGNWFTNAMSAAKDFVGDVIEYIKIGFKAVVRIVLKVVGPVLRLAIRIADTVLDFTIGAVSTLLSVTNTLLKNLLGVDLGKMFGLTFDVERIKRTQSHLNALFDGAVTNSKRFMKENKSTVTKGLAKAKKEVSKFVPDQRSQADIDESRATGNSIVSLIMNNPIMEILLKFNPISWLMEEVAEELGDLVQVPKLPESFKKIINDIGALVQEMVGDIVAICQDLVNQVGDFMNNKQGAADAAMKFMQNTFWTVWDAISRFIEAAWEMLLDAFTGMTEIFAGTWKIPFISNLFKRFAEQEFSLQNALTFSAAVVLNIVFEVQTGKLPFEIMPNPASLISRWDKTSLDLSPHLGLEDDEDEDSVLEKFGAVRGAVKLEKQMTAAEKAALKSYNKIQWWCELCCDAGRIFLCAVELVEVKNGEGAGHHKNNVTALECCLIGGNIWLLLARSVSFWTYLDACEDPLLASHVNEEARLWFHFLGWTFDSVATLALIRSPKGSNILHVLGVISSQIVKLKLHEGDWGICVAEIFGSIAAIASQIIKDPWWAGTCIVIDGVMSSISLTIEYVQHDPDKHDESHGSTQHIGHEKTGNKQIAHH